MNDELHEKFKANLRTSLPAVAAVAGWWIKQGEFDVKVPALLVPERFEDGRCDSGDMEVRRFGPIEDHPWKVIEVKGYTIPADRLFSYPAIIVDRKEGYEKKPKIALYFAVPAELDRALMLDHEKHRNSFSEMKIKDKVTGNLVECLMAPLECWKEIRL